MPKAANEKKTPPRDDGRRALTTYMFPDTIKNLKVAALEEDKNAYEIVEEAVLDWLKRRKKKPKS
jgi:hypothetical protein